MGSVSQGVGEPYLNREDQMPDFLGAAVGPIELDRVCKPAPEFRREVEPLRHGDVDSAHELQHGHFVPTIEVGFAQRFHVERGSDESLPSDQRPRAWWGRETPL